MCFKKKVFLKISQNSQENVSAKVSFLTKLQGGRFSGFILRVIYITEDLKTFELRAISNFS